MPETWKPPMTTGMPAARSGLAISQRTRILVRLHADQTDEAEIAVVAHVGDDAVDAHPGIGFVNRRDLDVDVGPEHLALGAIVAQGIDGRQRMRASASGTSG